MKVKTSGQKQTCWCLWGLSLKLSPSVMPFNSWTLVNAVLFELSNIKASCACSSSSFSTRQNSTSCNFASVAIPSFHCPKAFLGFSNSWSHSHLREKAPGQITRFLEEMGWPAQMCKHRHSFCWWPPSPRFESAQSLHLLEAAARC